MCVRIIYYLINRSKFNSIIYNNLISMKYSYMCFFSFTSKLNMSLIFSDSCKLKTNEQLKVYIVQIN